MTAVLTKGKPATKRAAAKKKKATKKQPTKATQNAKQKLYASLTVQLMSLLKGEYDVIAIAAIFIALLFNSLPNANCAGFYFEHGDELVLGPFQGNNDCVRIPTVKC